MAFALPHRHSQISFSILRINTSTFAPVSFLVPYNLAGMTLELFLTKTSPGFR